MMKSSSATVGPATAKSLVDIAVLDDDLDFIHYVEDSLKGEGIYQVRAFTHPDDLYLACQERRPEIVLLDMKMGPFRGDQVLERLQELHPEICIIVVTGYPSLEDMRATFKRKVFDYLAKPFSLAQMRQTLRNAIDGAGIDLAETAASALGPFAGIARRLLRPAETLIRRMTRDLEALQATLLSPLARRCDAQAAELDELRTRLDGLQRRTRRGGATAATGADPGGAELGRGVR